MVLPAKPRQIPAATFTGRSDLLDEINALLLRELNANPRITMSALGRRVGMSAPAVTERVQRLERAGVILGYRLEVDPAALGLPVTAFVRIRPALGDCRRSPCWPGGSARSASATGSPARTVSWSRCTPPPCPSWKNSSISPSLTARPELDRGLHPSAAADPAAAGQGYRGRRIVSKISLPAGPDPQQCTTAILEGRLASTLDLISPEPAGISRRNRSS